MWVQGFDQCGFDTNLSDLLSILILVQDSGPRCSSLVVKPHNKCTHLDALWQVGWIGQGRILSHMAGHSGPLLRFYQKGSGNTFF